MNRRTTMVAGAMAVLVLAVVALATSATGQTTSRTDGPARTITVSSLASITTAPDEAVVTFSVRADSPDSVAALNESSTIMNDVLAAMKALGIPERDMETTNINLAQQAVNRGTSSETTVFVSTTGLEVTIDDFDRIGPVIRDGVAAGATSVRGVRFQVSDPAEAKRKALDAAVRSARAKADALAEAAGASVTGVVQIREDGPGGYPRPYAADEATFAYASVENRLAVVPPRDIETEVMITSIWSLG
jgi:uncharacterized protein